MAKAKRDDSSTKKGKSYKGSNKGEKMNHGDVAMPPKKKKK